MLLKYFAPPVNDNDKAEAYISVWSKESIKLYSRKKYSREKSSVVSIVAYQEWITRIDADRSEQTSQKGFHTRGTECACAHLIFIVPQ